MTNLVFNAVMKIRGINPYVLVTKQQAEALKPGWRKPLPVIVRVNGQPEQPWRINMVPTGSGSFYLYLHGDVRKASKTSVGDTISVELAFDNAYHPGPDPLPTWFAAGLNQATSARQNWAKLSPSRQKEIIRYLANLKSDDARQRNLERALKALSGSPQQFLGRSWRNGK